MSLSRRAFLGALPVGGLALSSPWWVGWVAKHFGPTGTIHDRKVRVAAWPELEELMGVDPGFDPVAMRAFSSENISAMDAMLKEHLRNPFRDRPMPDRVFMNPSDFAEMQRDMAQLGATPANPVRMNTSRGQLDVETSRCVKRGMYHELNGETGVTNHYSFTPPKMRMAPRTVPSYSARITGIKD